MTSLGWNCLAFVLRLAACICPALGILAAALLFGLRGLSWGVVYAPLVGALIGAVLIVLVDKALWRARAELRRETGALR